LDFLHHKRIEEVVMTHDDPGNSGYMIYQFCTDLFGKGAREPHVGVQLVSLIAETTGRAMRPALRSLFV
jgi:hypothetical protein